MKLRTLPTQGPMRVRGETFGSVSGFAFLALAIAPAASVSGVMSSMTPERSRMTPSLSSMPGFSRPFGPKRSSFMVGFLLGKHYVGSKRRV